MKVLDWTQTSQIHLGQTKYIISFSLHLGSDLGAGGGILFLFLFMKHSSNMWQGQLNIMPITDINIILHDIWPFVAMVINIFK